MGLSTWISLKNRGRSSIGPDRLHPDQIVSGPPRTYKKPGLVGAPQRVPDPGGLGRWNRIAPRERVGGSAWLVRGSQVRGSAGEG